MTKTARVDLDQYFTPPLDVYRMLPVVADLIAGAGVIIEPSAGRGVITRCLTNIGVTPDRIIALEIDPVVAAKTQSKVKPHITDTLLTDLMPVLGDTGGADLIIGNPPYALASEFVEWGLRHLAPHGKMLYLLRVDFVGSLSRAQLLRENQPSLHVLTGRPSFVRKMKIKVLDSGEAVTTIQTTGQHNYAWFEFCGALRNNPGCETNGNTWLESDPHKIHKQYLECGLPLPFDLYWKYTAPLVDAQGVLIHDGSYKSSR